MGGGGGGEEFTSHVGGQGGRVKLAVEVLEGGSTTQKNLPRFVKPSGKRGSKDEFTVKKQVAEVEE